MRPSFRVSAPSPLLGHPKRVRHGVFVVEPYELRRQATPTPTLCKAKHGHASRDNAGDARTHDRARHRRRDVDPVVFEVGDGAALIEQSQRGHSLAVDGREGKPVLSRSEGTKHSGKANDKFGNPEAIQAFDLGGISTEATLRSRNGTSERYFLDEKPLGRLPVGLFRGG